jgi:hypothetical protein
MQGTIKGCSNYGDISSNATSQARIGGIAGYSDGGSIIGCSNYGKISGPGSFIGGIAGQTDNNGVIANCRNCGEINGTGNSYSWEESWETVLVGPLPAAQTQGKSQDTKLSGE